MARLTTASLTTSPPPEERLASLLRGRVRRVFGELPGAVAGEEEPLHQLRVASRRLRVALPLVARKERGRRVSRALRVLRQLTRAAGRGRDLDVLAGLEGDRLAALEKTGPEQRALLGRLRSARARSRRSLAEAILDVDIDGLRRDLRRLLRRGAADAPTVLVRLGALREAQAAALLRGWSGIGDRYRPVALHAQRRRIRRLRYAAEVADALNGHDSRAPTLWKRMQEAIGRIHDRDLLARWLEDQARSAAASGNARMARIARREMRHFVGEGKALHAALLETKPADLTLRALEAMARAERRGRRP